MGFFPHQIAEICLKEFRKSTEEQSKERMDRIKLFLNIFNSDWKTETLVHHCSAYCPCGGRGRPAVAQLAATLFVEIVYFSRPPIPALNRWLKCSATSRWFLCLGSTVPAGFEKKQCGLRHLLFLD